MFRPIILAAMLGSLAFPACGQPYFEPKRGSELRADLMDAIRPIAEWQLGAPVEFVIDTLRTDDHVAFAMVKAQRPGGKPIDMTKTPLAERDSYYLDDYDGPATMEVLMKRSDRMWVPVTYHIGSTEAWWDDDIYCPVWGAVIEEWCRD